MTFSLRQGTRQGCPLSPLNFALAPEPLAAIIRNTLDIIGFKRRIREDKISLYSDDALLYLGDTAGSLATTMTLIEEYGTYSGFSINWHKSVLIPLDPMSAGLPTGASQVAVESSFRKDYIPLNLKPILQK